MANPFVAEIRILAFNFAPKGWAFCDSQLLPISQNTALFSLLGTTYGGDGKSTFALPGFEGNTPVHVGGNQPGPGLSTYDLGQRGGEEFVTLLQSEIPAHAHQMRASPDPAELQDPTSARVLARSTPGFAYATGNPNTTLADQALAPAGGGLPHNNMQPYLTVNFCIALQGVFPQRP